MPHLVQESDRTDEVLISRMAAGDERALGALYDRHGGAAFAVAHAVTGDAADAEEAVTDAFMQVWRGASTFDAARGTVQAWLITIARSRALDRVRTVSRRRRLLESAAAGDAEGLATPLSSPGEQPDRAPERAETAVLVRRSLEALPAEQRRVVELAYFGGLSHSEIAAALEEPLGTVKTRARSALEKLRAWLQPLMTETG